MNATTYYSPTGNPEVWDERPEGYASVEEWEAARAAEEAKAEADRLAEYNSAAARAIRLRTERDARLAATDKYLLADYPISTEELGNIRTYRQALRDIPARPGAPWDGGGELTPWPELPEV